jgi:hypothetical protein
VRKTAMPHAQAARLLTALGGPHVVHDVEGFRQLEFTLPDYSELWSDARTAKENIDYLVSATQRTKKRHGIERRWRQRERERKRHCLDDWNGRASGTPTVRVKLEAAAASATTSLVDHGDGWFRHAKRSTLCVHVANTTALLAAWGYEDQCVMVVTSSKDLATAAAMFCDSGHDADCPQHRYHEKAKEDLVEKMKAGDVQVADCVKDIPFESVAGARKGKGKRAFRGQTAP